MFFFKNELGKITLFKILTSLVKLLMLICLIIFCSSFYNYIFIFITIPINKSGIEANKDFENWFGIHLENHPETKHFYYYKGRGFNLFKLNADRTLLKEIVNSKHLEYDQKKLRTDYPSLRSNPKWWDPPKEDSDHGLELYYSNSTLLWYYPNKNLVFIKTCGG